MLLLVTIVLVVIGSISLVIGFVQSALLPIYISIACSVLAAVVLLIFSRMTAKSQRSVTSGAGPAPLDLGRSRDDRTERTPAFSGTGLVGTSDGGETFAPEPTPALGSRYGALEDEDDVDLADDDFPIERYDSRRVGEILPLLAELDLDELDIVREHEEQGKSRATVLARIDQLIDQLEAEDRHEAATRFDTDADADFRAGAQEAPGPDPMAVDEPEADQVSAPAAVPPPPPTQAVSVAALPEDDGYFPIEDYDDLRASEILPLLPELDDDELEMVRERERSGAARSSVLQKIDELSAPSAAMAPPPPPPPAPEPEPVPAPVVSEVPSSSATRRASTKRAPAAKAPAQKAAPAAPRPRKVASAAAPAPVVPVAPVKKAPGKKVPVKKVAAKKTAPPAATTVTKIAPVKKAAPAAKATTKATTKAAPAAKVAAARAAAATKGGGTASAKAAKVAKAARKTTKG